MRAVRRGHAVRARVWGPAAGLLALLLVGPGAGDGGAVRAAAAKAAKAAKVGKHGAAGTGASDPVRGEYAAAMAALQAGRTVEAHDRLRRLLGAPDAAGQLSRAQQDAAGQILAGPRPAAGDVVPLGEPGTQVLVDEQAIGLLPLPVPLLLPVGTHQLAFLQGGQRLTAQVQVRADRTLEVRASRDAAAVLVSQPAHALLATTFDVSAGGGDSVAGLHTALEQGLRRARLAPLRASAEVQQQLADCKAVGSCLAAIAAQQEVDYVLVAEVRPVRDAERAAGGAGGSAPATAAGGVADAGVAAAGSVASAATGASGSSVSAPVSDWKLRVALFDARVADVAAQADDVCGGCAAAALPARLRDVVGTMATQGSTRARGRYVLSWAPAGAEVRVNGIAVGKGPIERTVWSGELQVEATLAGYHPLQVRRFVPEGGSERIELALERIPPPAPVSTLVVAPPPVTPRAVERAPRPAWRLAVGLSALAGGAAMVGFGAAALSVDGSCVSTAMAPARQCDRLYQTQTLGAGLVAGGAALAIFGIVLSAVPGPPRPSGRVALARTGR